MIRFLIATTILLPTAALAEDRATREDYVLNVSQSSAKLKVGEKGRFVLVVEAKRGKKIHPEAPLVVTLTTTEGVNVEKKKLSRDDAKDQKAKSPELSTAVDAVKAGDQSVTAEVRFFLCSDTWCQRMVDKVAVPITVTEK